MLTLPQSPTVRPMRTGAEHGPHYGPPWWREGRGEWRPRQGPRPFLAALVGAIQVVGTTWASGGQPDATHLDGLAYALLVAGPAALLLRRRAPLLALIVAVAATVAYALTDYPRGPFFVAALIALFGAVRRSRRQAVWAVVAAGYAGYLGLGWIVPRIGAMELARPSLAHALVVGVWVGVALALAEAARVRGEYFAEIARTRAESARARSEQSRRQASEERLRIARELHDVLGHHLSLINVRAGVALHLIDSQPEQAREALGAIKQASAEALREVRGVLAALHPQDESAPRSPAPGLTDLDRLADEARAAGLPLTVHREGEPRPLPAEVDRAAYRIIQEALTNVRRHAGPAATATVVVGYGQRALALRVDDTGAGPPIPTTPGGLDGDAANGIPGMRERAVALGGVLTTEALPGGGFRVDANLPLEPPAPHASRDPIAEEPR
jgi:signal transduction histidine kinase